MPDGLNLYCGHSGFLDLWGLVIVGLVDAEILCFLDDHFRYALSITCHQPGTGPAVVTTFRQAIADEGIPASVLSDNGMVFTTRFAGGRAGRDTINGFQAEPRHLGVIEKHSKPSQPPTCGKYGSNKR